LNKKRTFAAASAQDLIANDTGLQVSKQILSCVEKGMTFIPALCCSAQCREREAEGDLKRLKRVLNIRLHFSGSEDGSSKRSFLSDVLRSEWKPPKDRVSSAECWDQFRRTLVGCAKVRLL